MIGDRFEFEWDPDKAAHNIRKHGVRFEVATEVYFDEFAIFEEDRFSIGELREIATGLTCEGILVVVSTERREGVTRIISARQATKHERRRYQASRRAFDD